MAEESTERVLDEDDKADVTEALKFVQARWREIGTQLHLKSGTLNNFNGLNPATATGRMVEAYLAGNYNKERFGVPTWRKIVQAVESPAGGNNAAEAKRIADTYAKKEKFKSSYSSSYVVSDKPSPTAILPAPEVQSYDKIQVENFPPLKGNNVVVDGPNFKMEFEQFEPLPKDDWLREVQMTFGPVKPEEKKKITTINEAYDMSQWPHGVCVIINNEEFKLPQHKSREGTDKDEYNLVQTFRHLGYIVEVHRDCTKDKILDIFEEVQVRNELPKYDSFVCCILSHGKEGFIIGSNSEDISLETITNKFNGDRCINLASKPKLFFFQACRGTHESKAIEVSVPEDKTKRVVADSDTKMIPNNADFFFSYATPLKHSAWRNEKEGSWYVTELCRSLTTYGIYSDLQSMVTWVNRQVAEKYSDNGTKQQPVSTSRLHKNVFFF